MNDLVGQKAELSMTITIKRKETGKEETFTVVGHSDPEKLKEIVKQMDNKD